MLTKNDFIREDSQDQNQSYRILLAEDDTEMLTFLAQSLRFKGYHVAECPNGIELLDHLGAYLLLEENEQYDVIISDIRMPGVNGLEILEGLSTSDGFPPFILITAFGDQETHDLAKKFGAAVIMDKPFDIDDLFNEIRNCLPIRDQNSK